MPVKPFNPSKKLPPINPELKTGEVYRIVSTRSDSSVHTAGAYFTYCGHGNVIVYLYQSVMGGYDSATCLPHDNTQFIIVNLEERGLSCSE